MTFSNIYQAMVKVIHIYCQYAIYASSNFSLLTSTSFCNLDFNVYTCGILLDHFTALNFKHWTNELNQIRNMGTVSHARFVKNSWCNYYLMIIIRELHLAIYFYNKLIQQFAIKNDSQDPFSTFSQICFGF